VKVFLDTNVLVSAFGTRGLCADVFRESLLRHELVISDPLLVELKQVLKKKFGVPPSLIDEILVFLKTDTLFKKSKVLHDIPIKDKKDRVIISSALDAKAEVFVTGDKEILRLKHYKKLSFASPRQFWNELTR